MNPLITATTKLVNLLLDNADVNVIGAANWWPRAHSAIETAAAGGETFGHAVTIAARKLQIETLIPKHSPALASIEEIIKPAMEEWRELVQRESVYIIALTQVEREERKNPKPPLFTEGAEE